MCNENETKAEFMMSHDLLIRFLKDEKVIDAVGKRCIDAVISFAEMILDKEKYLANYRRKYVTNCMDSLTTSPVESQNNVIHNTLGVRLVSIIICDITISAIVKFHLTTVHVYPE